MRKITVICFIIIMLFTVVCPYAQNTENDPLQPRWRTVEKFKIGYSESSPYNSYTAHFYGLLVGLQELGWIDSIKGIPYEFGQNDTEKMWQWLVENQPSEYLEFLPENYYSFSGDNQAIDEAYQRVHTQTPGVDLMLVMGTSAGRSLTKEAPTIPILVFSTSNAIASEIIKSETDSGKDNVWAHVDTTRYKKQVQVLYDLFQFKKLGIVFDDTIEGRSYADLENVKAVCDQLGVELVYRNVSESKSDTDYSRYRQEMKSAFDDLSDQVDGFYLTAGNLEPEELSELFESFYQKKIPVFSQIGGEEVQYGAIMSTAANYEDIGRYGAQIISRSLHGENIRYLSAVYEDTPNIVINLDVARKIEYTFDFEVLLIADKIYITQ